MGYILYSNANTWTQMYEHGHMHIMEREREEDYLLHGVGSPSGYGLLSLVE